MRYFKLTCWPLDAQRVTTDNNQVGFKYLTQDYQLSETWSFLYLNRGPLQTELNCSLPEYVHQTKGKQPTTHGGASSHYIILTKAQHLPQVLTDVDYQQEVWSHVDLHIKFIHTFLLKVPCFNYICTFDFCWPQMTYVIHRKQ